MRETERKQAGERERMMGILTMGLVAADGDWRRPATDEDKRQRRHTLVHAER